MKSALLVAIASTALLASPAFAADGSWNVDASGNWSDASNWTPGSPNGAGSTANLTFNISANQQVTLDISRTVGTLNIGDIDGTNNYTLTNSGGATLTLESSGSGAQINDTSTGLSDTINLPLILADNLTISDNSTNTGQFNINGGITGTGNLTINNNNPNGSSRPDGNAVVISSNVNNVGTLNFNGTGTGDVRLQGGIGSNVTQINVNSVGTTYFAGPGITVASGGTTLALNAGSTKADGGTSFVGTGNAVLDNNTSTDDALTIGGPNNVGSVTSEGTGTGLAQINGNVGTNVTSLIIASGATSGIEFRGGNLTINTSGATYLIDNSNISTAKLEAKQTIIGTGDLILQNNSTVDGGVQLDENSENNVGNIINNGTGTGESSVSNTLGANLTGVVENSSASAIEFRNSGTAFTGVWKVQTGTMIFSGGTGNFQDGSNVIVGDTAAHGAASFLHLNIDGGTWTTGAAQTLSGFGTVTSQNIATVSGTTIAPGSVGNIGKLTLNQNLTVASGTSLTFILGTPGANNSQLAIGGNLSLNSLITLNLLDNAGANGQGSIGDGTYTLITYGSLTGPQPTDITSLFNITGPAGYTFDVTNTGSSAGSIELTVTGGAVPEPGTWALLLGGLTLLLTVQKFRRGGACTVRA